MEVGAIPDAALRGNSRVQPRYRTRAKRLWNDSGSDHAIASMPVGYEPTKLRFTFTFSHWRKIDLDNLAIGMKPWVDGFVSVFGPGYGDDPAHVVYGEHEFTSCRKGQSKTEVLVTEVSVTPVLSSANARP